MRSEGSGEDCIDVIQLEPPPAQDLLDELLTGSLDLDGDPLLSANLSFDACDLLALPGTAERREEQQHQQEGWRAQLAASSLPAPLRSVTIAPRPPPQSPWQPLHAPAATPNANTAPAAPAAAALGRCVSWDGTDAANKRAALLRRYWELKRPREEGAAQARLPLLAPPRTRAWSATVKLPKTSCPQSPFVSSQLSPFVAAPQQSPFVAAQPQSPFVAAQQQQQQPLPLAASQQLAAAARLPSPGASQTLAGTLSMGASPLAHMPHSCPLGASLAFNSSLATGPSQALAMSQQDFAAYATVFQDTVVRERRRRESQERRLRQLQLEQRAAQEASLRACVSWQGPEAGGAAQISPEASCALPPVASVNASGMCAELADMALEVADSPGQQSPTEGQCATEPDVPLAKRARATLQGPSRGPPSSELPAMDPEYVAFLTRRNYELSHEVDRLQRMLRGWAQQGRLTVEQACEFSPSCPAHKARLSPFL